MVEGPVRNGRPSLELGTQDGDADMPIHFSDFFQLSKSQLELDFVDVPIDGDIPLFIDPYALSQRVDRWSQQAHLTLIDFFERIVSAIRGGAVEKARQLLLHLQ